MWQRSELKTSAKQSLTRKYWNAFAASLVVSLLASGSNFFTFTLNRNDFNPQYGQQGRFFSDFNFDRFRQFFGDRFGQSFDPDLFGGLFTGFWLLVVLTGVLFGLFGLAYQIFVSPVLQVGGNRWFSRSRESAATPTIGIVFGLFKTGSYLKTVGSMLWMNLFLFLWSLIAMIPLLAGVTWVIVQSIGQQLNWHGFAVPEWLYGWLGGTEAAMLAVTFLIVFASALMSLPVIIKQYSYRMTPWILADNPQIGYKRALKLSMQMTRGHKWGMFVLDLSFIGWYILGMMACGIGVFFVMPYYLAVQAELYARLRRISADQNFCTMEELGFMPVNPVGPPVAAASEMNNHEPDL